ncbi:MAG: D-aminoacylase [Longimicrobiales bacterium]|nr:D-aminoacylase [Longimicrobiales bacterium]
MRRGGRGTVPTGGTRAARVAPRAVVRWAAAGVCGLALAAGSVAGQAGQRYDVLLRNGLVLDGSGNPWFRADVAIRGGRIAAVGDLAGARAATELDVGGLFVAPGFIDTHSHAGPGLATPGLSHARPLLAQGITTVFINPDGGGAVDLAAQRAELLRDGLGVNVAQMVPHGSVRGAVLGSEDRRATPEELERMRALVRAGMEAGGWGLSSGPFYAPGSYSDTHELVELAKVAAAYGGAYTSHVRDESDYTVGVVAALDEVITVAREAGLPGVHTHIKVLGPPVWGYSAALVHRIEQARAQGVEVYADQYPYLASATGLDAALIPRWAQAGGRDSLEVRLARADDRARIRVEVVDNLARRGGADRIQFRRVRWDESWEGKLLSDVARAWGMDPVDAAMEMVSRGSASIVSFNMHERDVRTLMDQPWTMTASDGDLVPWQEGVPHPRSYGTFPRKIRTYVLEAGVVTLEDAVRSMTSLPARVFRMGDRGLLEPGKVADLVVFDLERLRDRATFTEPHQLSEGVVHVFVNGRAAVLDGAFTEVRAGEVLHRLGARQSR